MRTKRRTAAVCAVLLLAACPALSTAYEIHWYTIDGGGGPAVASGGYMLQGSMGQPDAGTAVANGGYVLFSGYQAPTIAAGIPGDCDNDGDVDADDNACIVACIAGPGVTPAANCSPWDFDADGDVDLADWSNFARLLGD